MSTSAKRKLTKTVLRKSRKEWTTYERYLLHPVRIISTAGKTDYAVDPF